MNEVDYKKKIRLCEKLGANRFQKVVFKVEELKYKVIKKLFPRYIEWYDKLCDRFKKRDLKKAKTKQERKRVIDHYRNQKMLMRKEYHREQNRNYHMDPNKPTEILQYLNWNKAVHTRGLAKDGLFLGTLAVATILGISPTVTVPLILTSLGSAFVNFQCVNIQNCNIYRMKQKEESIRRLEERQNTKSIERYSEAAQVISRSMDKTEDIPTMEQVIGNIQTKEELEQLKLLVQTTLKSNKQSSMNNQSDPKKGGK